MSVYDHDGPVERRRDTRRYEPDQDPDDSLLSRGVVFRFNLGILGLLGAIFVAGPVAALAAGVIAGEPLAFLAELAGAWRLAGPSGLLMLGLCGVAAVSSVQAMRRRHVKGLRMRLSLLALASLLAAVGVVAVTEIVAGS